MPHPAQTLYKCSTVYAQHAMMCQSRHPKRIKKIRRLYAQAYTLGRQAAELIPREDNPVYEETRAIWYRSAGWCAYYACLLPEAQEMADKGLAICKDGVVIRELKTLKRISGGGW